MTSTSSTSAGFRPLFLLSQPRRGSTLVQRVLAAHPKISTTAEPWILLPLVYARRWNGIRAEYAHQLAAHNIEQFASALDGGPASSMFACGPLSSSLYTDAADEGAIYFLDKTPHITSSSTTCFAFSRTRSSCSFGVTRFR